MNVNTNPRTNCAHEYLNRTNTEIPPPNSVFQPSVDLMLILPHRNASDIKIYEKNYDYEMYCWSAPIRNVSVINWLIEDSSDNRQKQICTEKSEHQMERHWKPFLTLIKYATIRGNFELAYEIRTKNGRYPRIFGVWGQRPEKKPTGF